MIATAKRIIQKALRACVKSEPYPLWGVRKGIEDTGVPPI